MKLNYITIMVRDIEKTVDFYQKIAGLQVIKRFNPGMGEIVFMADKAGDTQLEFIQFDNAEKVSAVGLTMSFLIKTSIEELRNKAIDMGYSSSEIIDNATKPPHFTVLDPDNINIEFSL